MLGTIQAESRLVKSCLARYRQNHVGYNTDGVSDIRYNTDRLTLCIIQSHVGYDTGGITLGTVQAESRWVVSLCYSTDIITSRKVHTRSGSVSKVLTTSLWPVKYRQSRSVK